MPTAKKKREKILCPSMMCADFTELKQEVQKLEAAGADMFHCDVMDGNFVPNMALGPADIAAIRRCTKKPLDVHLMIERPENKVDLFAKAGADIIYIHPEATVFTAKTLAHLRELNVHPGIAIDPDTSIATVEELLGSVDYILVMTVNPGFAGQKYIDSVTDKIRRLAALKKKYHYQIVIDGACSPQRIQELFPLGADGFVLGTSALFGKEQSYAECMKALR